MSIDAALEPEISPENYHKLLISVVERLELFSVSDSTNPGDIINGIIEHDKVNRAIEAFFDKYDGEYDARTKTYVKLAAQRYNDDIRLLEPVLDTMLSAAYFTQEPDAAVIPAGLALEYSNRDLKEAAGIVLLYVRVAARKQIHTDKLADISGSLRGEPVFELAEMTKDYKQANKAFMHSIGRAAINYQEEVVDDIASALQRDEVGQAAQVYNDESETSQNIMIGIATISFLTRGSGTAVSIAASGALKNKDHPRLVERFINQIYIGHLKGEISGGKFSSECADFFADYRSVGV